MFTAYFTANILICRSRKSTGGTKHINSGSGYSNVLVSHDTSMHNTRTLKPRQPHRSAINHFIIRALAFPSVICQNVFCETSVKMPPSLPALTNLSSFEGACIQVGLLT